MLAKQEVLTIEEAQAEVDWSRARCRDGAATMLPLFFSEQLDDIARAKAICAKCPVIESCLEGALVRREPWGVWGGQLFANGKVLAFKRKRGRPPKNPRPEEVAAFGPQLTA
jgi:WhiB family transcriptional regulator, redox-sensing transcriptional regulator